jgi:hypothetical protein
MGVMVTVCITPRSYTWVGKLVELGGGGLLAADLSGHPELPGSDSPLVSLVSYCPDCPHASSLAPKLVPVLE